MPISGGTIREIDEAKESDNAKLVEAVLFISGRFLTMQELVTHTDLTPMAIKDAIERLKGQYDKINNAIYIS